jgi:hypothetical protein
LIAKMERICDGLWHINLNKNATVKKGFHARPWAYAHVVVAMGTDVQIV